jgi:hypothetical protein
MAGSKIEMLLALAAQTFLFTTYITSGIVLEEPRMTLDLQTAYQILGLPQGSARELVQSRYKQLVKTFHPDRFTTAHDKAFAEEELKKINAAREFLETHWTKTVPVKENTAPNDWTSAATAKEKVPDPPQEGPWWQTVLDAIKAESVEPLKKYDKKYAVDDCIDDIGTALKFTRDIKQRRLWATLIVFLLIALYFVSNGSSKASAVVHDKNKGVPVTHSLAPTDVSTAEAERRQREELARLAEERETKNQSRQKQYFLKLAIDRCNVAIRQDELLLTQIELKLAGSHLAIEERRRLRDLQDFHNVDRVRQLEEKEVLLAQLAEQK